LAALHDFAIVARMEEQLSKSHKLCPMIYHHAFVSDQSNPVVYEEC
jgi:hypothetical protein